MRILSDMRVSLLCCVEHGLGAWFYDLVLRKFQGKDLGERIFEGRLTFLRLEFRILSWSTGECCLSMGEFIEHN